jgi:hypothetical protein
MKQVHSQWGVSLSLWDLFRLGLCILISCASIRASINRGSIRGTVTDPQGAVMPNAQITITDMDTGVHTTGQTNTAGFYLFSELVPGSYTVHFEAKGFISMEVTRIAVKPNEVSTVDMQLRLGATAQRIEVTATNALVETSPTNIGTAVDQRYMEDLPILGRDTQSLVNLVPGVTSSVGPPGTLVGFNGGQFGGFPDAAHIVGSFLSANGGQPGSSEWYLDGNLNSAVGQNNMVVNPPPDALAEFQTINTAYAAEYGRAEGAVFSQVLKSGTNTVHGDLYEYNRNSHFSARNPVAPLTPTGQVAPPNFVNWNQFGGTIGGPIVIPHIYNGKNKTFFFAAWDISLLHSKAAFLGTVPTLLQRQGNFSEFPNVVQYGLYDPMTTTYDAAQGVFNRQPFLNSDGSLATSLPANRLDPTSMWFMSQYPVPNFLDPRQQDAAAGGCLNTCNNYRSTYSDSQTTHSVVVKVDHEISEKDKLFVEWLWNPTYYKFISLPWSGATAPPLGLNGYYPYDIKNQLATLGETHTFSPTLVNEFRFTYTRQFDNPTLAPAALTDQAGVLQHLAGSNIQVFPPFDPVPSFDIGQGPLTTLPSFGTPVNVMQISVGAATVLDNITKVWSKHTIKVGFMYRTDIQGTVQPTLPNLVFGGSLVQNAVTGQGGNPFAQFELGAADQFSLYYVIASTIGSDHYFGAYVQDDYRVTPKFTLNVGLRWDMFGWQNDRHNNFGLFDPNIPNPDDPARMGGVVYMGTPQHPSSRPFPAHHKDFAPRVNFSYSPFADHKTVIRGGIDMIYANDITNVNGPSLGANESVGFTYLRTFSNFDASGHGLFLTNQVPGFILGQGAPTLQINLPSKQENLQFTGSDAAGGVFTMRAIPHDPYVFLWNLQVQRELPGNWVISAGYVASKGTHILSENGGAYNYVPTAAKLKYKSQLNYLVPMPTDLVAAGFPADYFQSQLLIPIPQYLAGSVSPVPGNNNITFYNALQMRVEKRFSHGFDLLAAYTNQKNIVSANLGSFVSNTWVGNSGWNVGRGRITSLTFSGAQDPDNIRGDRALSVDDTPQILNTVFSYDLPFGPGRAFGSGAEGITRHLIQGWKIVGNFNIQSGIPLGISGPCNSLTCRVNLIGNPRGGRAGKTRYQLEQQYYNPSAFEAVFGSDPTAIALATSGTPDQLDAYVVNGSYPFWRFGTMGVRSGSVRSPGFWNMDTSIGKDFIISETKRLEFRANAFNAFNHQNLGTPNLSWCLGPNADGSTDAVHQFGCQFGRITTVQTDPRAWQFSLKFAF